MASKWGSVNQWVFYDDGGAGDVDQAESASGTLATTATTASTTNAVNQQISSSSGVASALASLNAGTSAVNTLANVQDQSSSGVVNAQGFTAASTLVSHVQSAASTGLVNAQANSAAITQAVNSLANSQIASSSGVTSSAASTQAVTGATHSQALSTNAISTSVGSSAANTVAVNELFTLVQAVESGGITSVYATAIATTQANIEQVVNASGVADAVASTNANTLGQEFDSPWSTPTILFSEAQPIEQISLTFDQLGRPLVFYRVGEDTLKLYWYDPVAQQNVTTTLTTGKDPTACFDFPQDTGQSFTDALLFYVRDDQVFMRVQRDRYAIEYPCPAMQPGLRIKSAGLRSDNRLQVVYQFRDDNYVKPVIPVPPPPPGLVDGVSKYFFSGWNSGIETPWRMAGPIADTEFEIGMEITGFEPSRISTYVSPTFRSTVSQGGRADFIQDPRIVAEHIIFAITAGKSAGGLNSSAISGFAELAVSTVRTQSNIVRSLFIHYQNYPDQVVNLNVGLGEYDTSLLRFVFGPRLNDQPNRRSLTIVGTFKNAGQPQDPEMVDRVICETDMPAGVLANDLFNNAAVNSRLFFGTRLAFFPDGRPVYAYSLLGTISNCYARDGNNVTQWPITTRGQATQPSTPPGKDAVIINHDSVLWGYTQP